MAEKYKNQILMWRGATIALIIIVVLMAVMATNLQKSGKQCETDNRNNLIECNQRINQKIEQCNVNIAQCNQELEKCGQSQLTSLLGLLI